MPPKRKEAAAKDKNEAPPAKTAKGEKKIVNEKAPPKSQQQGATGEKEDAPETADVSLIEATQAVGGGEEFVNNCAAGFNMMLDSAVKLSAQAIVAEIIRRNENKKAASPPKKNKGEIEASPAKIIKDKEEKKCSKVHELYGLLHCAQVMVDEDQEILRKCGEEDLFRSN